MANPSAAPLDDERVLSDVPKERELQRRFINGDFDVEEYERRLTVLMTDDAIDIAEPAGLASYYGPMTSGGAPWTPWPPISPRLAPVPPPVFVPENPSPKWLALIDAHKNFAHHLPGRETDSYPRFRERVAGLELEKRASWGVIEIRLTYRQDRISVELVDNCEGMWSSIREFTRESEAEALYQETASEIVRFGEAMGKLGWKSNP